MFAACLRNVEVHNSIEDLIELAQTHPRENLDVQLDEQSISSFRGHYSNAMYQASSAAHRHAAVWHACYSAATTDLQTLVLTKYVHI